MNQKQNDELAFQLRENLKKRKDQKKSLGEKSNHLRNKKIGSSSLLQDQIKKNES